MRLKSFYGPTVTEVMRAVRDALGENAIIVATRDDEMGGVRVTAAIEEQPIIETAQETSYAPPEPDGSETIEYIASALLAHDTPSTLAERFLATATQIASEDSLVALGAALDMHLKFQILPDEPPCKPVLFIGPPGAGKTSCTAKMAAKATLAGTPITVVSTDTERAGGMAQLAAITRLLEKDIYEIEDIDALKDIIAIQPAGTLVLIDTAGCHPFEEKDKQKLASLIKASGALPVLVLPADLESNAMLEMAKTFKGLGAQILLPTRLDMTRRLGGFLRMAYETKLPLALFSASSKVTEAPAPLNPVSLARLLLPKAEDNRQTSEDRKRAVS